MGVITDSGCFKGTLTAFDKREIINLVLTKKMLANRHIQEQNAEDIIQNMIDEHGDKIKIGWSGGKCSTVVLKLALKYYPKIPVVFENTLCEYPENLQFVRQITKEWNLNLTELTPKTNFFAIKSVKGWPKIRCSSSKDREPFCCKYLKHEPLMEYYKTHDITGDLTGVRAGESKNRRRLIGCRGQVYTLKNGRVIGNPVALWTRQEIDAFLLNNMVPENLVYRSQMRNGCMWCTAFKGCKEALIRYSLWRFNDLRLYDFVVSDMLGKRVKQPILLAYPSSFDAKFTRKADA